MPELRLSQSTRQNHGGRNNLLPLLNIRLEVFGKFLGDLRSDTADFPAGIVQKIEELLQARLILEPLVDRRRDSPFRMVRIVFPNVGNAQIALRFLESLGIIHMGGDDLRSRSLDDWDKLLSPLQCLGAVVGMERDGFPTSGDLIAVEVDFSGSLGE